MYHDDPYHPNLPNDYDEPIPNMEYEYENDNNNDARTEVTSSTLDTRQRRMRKLNKEQKTLDKGFAAKKFIDGRNSFDIQYYHTSYTPDATIRNAVTGIYQTPHRVGRESQDLYFKVVYPGAGTDGSHQLFYDSPEQYETHFRCRVQEDVRRKWNDRIVVARKREQDLYNRSQENVVVR